MPQKKKSESATSESIAWGNYLKIQLDHGVRPDGNRRPWKTMEFAKSIGRDGQDRTVRFWFKGESVPDIPNEIADAVFGDNPDNKNYRKAFLDYYAKAKASRKKSYNPSSIPAGSISIPDLFWHELEKTHNLKIGDRREVSANTLQVAKSLLRSLNPDHSSEAIDAAINGSHQSSFDIKYGDFDFGASERSNLEGVYTDWKDEFLWILDKFGCVETLEKTVLCVGMNEGAEGEGLYSRSKKHLVVDISRKALLRAKARFPNSKTIFSSAQKIEPVSTGTVDLYISLKTYNSSFFDIFEAVLECKRVLAMGGVCVISIANKYQENGAYYSGLSRTDYRLVRPIEAPKYFDVDPQYSWELVFKITRYLIEIGIRDISIMTGKSEIYVLGRK